MKKKDKDRLFKPRERLKKCLLPLLSLGFVMASVSPIGASAQPDSNSLIFSSTQMTVDKVFDAIVDQLKYEVFCSETQLDVSKTVRLPKLNMELPEVLDLVLGNGFTYRIKDRTIIVSPASQQAETSRKIEGVVVDEKGRPLPGVTIVIKGTYIGAVSDENGKYALNVPGTGNSMLVFSFIGRKAKELPVPRGNQPMKVVMEESSLGIDEVVVTGYQNIRPTEMVGSYGSFKGKDLSIDGASSIEQMLQGKLPGMLVMNQSGQVGTRQKVRVRGTSTLLSNPEPVWVVDGIIQSDPIPFQVQDLGNMGDNMDMIKNFVGNGISWLNPHDIEDIIILKDASATVLYGVRAANGVIVITTKRGKEGTKSVSYSGGMVITDRLNYRKMNLMNSKERVDVSRELYTKRLLGKIPTESVGYEYYYRLYMNKEITYQEFNDAVKYLETVNTDWMDILFRTPFSHNHSVSFSGGSNDVSYYTSLSYNKLFGTAKGNEQESYGASVRINAKVTDKIEMGFTLNGNLATTDGFYAIDPYNYALETSRAIPCYDENGRPFYYMKENGYRFNILNELEQTGNTNDKRALSATVFLNYTFLPGFRFESNLGLNSSTTAGETYASEYTNYITNIRRYEFGEYSKGSAEYAASQLPHGGQLNKAESRNLSYTWRNQLTYNHVFGRQHRMGLLLGQEIRSDQYRELATTIYGYLPDRGKSFATVPPTFTHYGTQVKENELLTKANDKIVHRSSNYVSFYGSGTYSFDERYVVTGSLRSDASNRFGQDKRNRFLPIWSVGGRWNMHNEQWMQNQNLISELNLRATYGWQGNVAENFGPDLIAYIPDKSVNPIMGEYQLKIKSLAYGDLRWEKTKTMNFGIDIGLVNNRFTATVEYYRKKTEDMIVYKEVATEFGISYMPINGGNMFNQGIEVLLNGTIIRAKDFVWSLSLNTSKNINRVDSNISRNDLWSDAVAGKINKRGYAVSSFWAFEYLGLNQEYGYPLLLIPTREENPDSANDATAYMKYMGRFEPDFSGGLSTTFRYKRLSLSASFNLNIGGKRFLYNMFETFDIFGNQLPSAYMNLPKEFVNRWRNPGDQTNIPAIPSYIYNPVNNMYEGVFAVLPTGVYENVYDLYNYSDIRVVNASFFRCNNISLSYNFPERVLSYLNLKNLSMTFAVSNPFIITSRKFRGMDPEVASGNQPITKNYSFGVNVSF